jgi:hypothetical protein
MSVSRPSLTPLEHVGASTQRPLLHTPLAQSALSRQVPETPHLASQISPQSTSPSLVSRSLLKQVVGWRHTPALQLLLRQSQRAAQPWPSAHAAKHSPPPLQESGLG